MSIRPIIAAIIFFSLAETALAASQSIPADRKITRINIYNGSALITYEPRYKNSQGCTHKPDQVVRVDLNTDSERQMYATALAAATAGRPVGFGVNGCASSGKYTKVYRVDVGY